MTVRHLISILERCSEKAIVLAFDADAGEIVEVTGILYGGLGETVEICTDSQD